MRLFGGFESMRYIISFVSGFIGFYENGISALRNNMGRGLSRPFARLVQEVTQLFLRCSLGVSWVFLSNSFEKTFKHRILR